MQSRALADFNPEEDFQTIDKILGGNVDAFETLQKKYSKAINVLVGRMIRDPEDAKDIVQETFIRAYLNLSSFRREYSFHSWLFKIASNLCIDFMRRKRLQTISIEQPYPSSDEDSGFDIPEEGVSADSEIMQTERNKLLKEALDSLPENYRKVIELRHFEEMDYKQIASILCIPIGTVKAHLFRARKLLLEKLKNKRLSLFL
jgi:RNA polymerase sigma-70 factor (ECF subfamily)